MSIKSEFELLDEATKRVKEIIIKMNGLSEEGFNHRYNNDPYFRRGFDVFVRLFMDAKFR